jgi:hypothetical protein
VGPVETGSPVQKVDPPCRVAWQGTRSSGPQPGQCGTRNLKRTDVQEEASGTTRMQQCHKVPRHNLAAKSEEEEENQQHKRTELKTVITSGK